MILPTYKMNAVFFSKNSHSKNLHFIKNCKKINFTIIDDINKIGNFKNYDFVYSISQPKKVIRFPHTKFIFGPQFSVFPDNENDKLTYIKQPNAVYNCLSKWVIDLWKLFPVTRDLTLVALPFGVDTENFNEIKSLSKREKVFIYFKERDPIELEFVKKELEKKNILYTVFDYSIGYYEKDYIDCLHESKYGIWIGRHESQGFALQEALSCNVPLLVWDVRYMKQQYKNTHVDKNYPGTCIPYWHEKCGEFFYNKQDFLPTYSKFIEKIEKYEPRKYIVENLSIDACENRIIEFVKNMKI